MANDHYIERLKGWANSGRENIASPKILQIADYVDFDTIETVLDIGSWHLKQSIEFAMLFLQQQFTHLNLVLKITENVFR